MLESKSRRGRPKGTGIDDSDRIARLTELIRTRPELKPTTAIKAMGITDPSVIRRLRDKYKVSTAMAVANAPTPHVPAKPAAAVSGPAKAELIGTH